MGHIQIKPLNDIVLKIVGGGTPSKAKAEYWNGDIPWLSVKDMKDDTFFLDRTQDTITQLGVEKSSTNIIPKGTIILSTRMGLGRCLINTVDMAINQDLKALVLNEKVVNRNYLFYVLKSKAEEIEAMGSGTTVKGIRLDDLRSIEIPLPPLKTQQKIASLLSNYDKLIENNTQRIKVLESMAEELYKEWFVRLRFPGYEDVEVLDGVPEGWEREKLVSLCERFTDGTHDSPKEVDDEDGYYLVTGKHLINNQINFENAYKISEEDHLSIMKRSSLKKKDILFSNIGTLGNVAMVTNFSDFSCKNVFIFTPMNNVEYFLYEFLKFPSNKEMLLLEANGATQKFISLQYMRSLTILMPPLSLIHSFNIIQEATYKSIENLFLKNQTLKQTRDLLLPRLMSGKLNVEDLDII